MSLRSVFHELSNNRKPIVTVGLDSLKYNKNTNIHVVNTYIFLLQRIIQPWKKKYEIIFIKKRIKDIYHFDMMNQTAILYTPESDIISLEHFL